MTLYAIVTEDGLDQVVETSEQARKERKDLQALGCIVSVVKCATWEAVDTLEQTLIDMA